MPDTPGGDVGREGEVCLLTVREATKNNLYGGDHTVGRERGVRLLPSRSETEDMITSVEARQKNGNFDSFEGNVSIEMSQTHNDDV